jgi:hypothetical protein
MFFQDDWPWSFSQGLAPIVRGAREDVSGNGIWSGDVPDIALVTGQTVMSNSLYSHFSLHGWDCPVD